MSARPYQNGLFSCCSPFPLCLKATFCTCIVYGENHKRITTGEEGTSWGACCGWFGLNALGGFGAILQCLDRRTMQRDNNLEGSGFGACCTSLCCSCCEVIQTKKELDYIKLSQKESSLGYQSQPGMVAVSPAPYGNSPAAPHGSYHQHGHNQMR